MLAMATKIWTGVALFATVGASPVQDQMWNKFKVQFGRSYDNGAEEGYRRGIFEKNLEFIAAENAKDEGYSLGVNQFADLLTTEWSSQYFGMAPPTLRFGGAPYLGHHEVLNATLPESVDWVAKGAVTPIKDQKQCGSCWAFSATGALEGAYAIASGKLLSFSEQQLVDCAQSFGEQGCSGGLMDGAFQYAHKYGMCTEDSYPYEAADDKCEASKCTAGLPSGQVVGFKDVQSRSMTDLMSAVALQPVSIAIEADKMSFQLYRDGVLTVSCGTSVDHGVLVVGYGTHPTEGDYWKVKNSWGTTWGVDGYILLKRGKGGLGECGILTMPSYPVIADAMAEITV